MFTDYEDTNTLQIDLSELKPIYCRKTGCPEVVGITDGLILIVPEKEDGSLGVPAGNPRRCLDEEIAIEGLDQDCLDRLSEIGQRRAGGGSRYWVSGWILKGRRVNISCRRCTGVRKFVGADYLIDDSALFDMIEP